MIKSKIVVEKITVSDPHYTISDVAVESGSKVTKGQYLFSFETSKSAVDIDAPEEGFLYHQLKLGSQVTVGQTIGYISDENTHTLENLFQNEPKKETTAAVDTGVILSGKAAMLIKEHNLNISLFANITQVKEKDVLAYLSSVKNTAMPFTRAESNDIIIIGGRGGAKMVIEAIRSANNCSIKGIIDTEMPVNEHVLGVPVIGNESMLDTLLEQGYRNVVLSFTLLSNLPLREERYKWYKNKGFKFPNIIHSRATVEPSVKMGEGNIILANSMLGSDVVLGNINFINTGAMICHDTAVHQNNHFAPNAVLAGRISVGRNNIFGMCSTTYFDVKIGNGNIINNGVNIFADLHNNKIIKD
jgi:sugar O-acyltransferase (sialic acid O-acetyltransferase NeuD family)